MPDHPIDPLLESSLTLYQAINKILGNSKIYDLDRAEASHRLCSLSLEHGSSVIFLIVHGNDISAASLVRLQFEALVRAMWVWYAAPEEAVEKLLAPVSAESLQKASDLPGVSVMLKALAKADDIPQMAVAMLLEFKDKLLNELHSLVHSGFLPYKLYELGEVVAIDSIIARTVKHSNGLVTMTGMMMALLSGEESVITPMTKIQHQFKNCLPDLIAPHERH